MGIQDTAVSRCGITKFERLCREAMTKIANPIRRVDYCDAQVACERHLPTGFLQGLAYSSLNQALVGLQVTGGLIENASALAELLNK